MEYADGGDIFQLIKDSQKDQKLIDEDDIWKIFIQATRGLRVLHDMKIIHRDLKVINRSLRIDNI
jgi:serine/threonine protein kinase